MSTAAEKAIFLDRDGTIIVDKHYLKRPEDVELIPGAKEALALLKSQNYLLFLLSNQSGVGRGLLTMEDVQLCHQQMLRLLNIPQVFSEIKYAPERPDEPTVYRKPSPKFLHEMMEKYAIAPENVYMVGDKDSDVLTGHRAGVRSIFIPQGDYVFVGDALLECKRTTTTFPSLLDFARWVTQAI